MDCNKSIFDAPLVNWKVYKYLLTHQAILCQCPHSQNVLSMPFPVYMFNSSLVQVLGVPGTSHQGLTRTYYKIRDYFFIRDLYKYLHLYIMSCRVCSVRRDIPFNKKERSWSSQVIHDFAIMESIGMDLKVMPTSFCRYNYLLVM